MKENWRQFSILVMVTAFVGAMVGLERAVLPLLAEGEFGIASRTAILSFIATFGLAKALSNLVAGRFADRFGRKRILVAGWLLGLPVPLMIWLAPSWSWIVAANVLLGVNQGLTWSSTVIMKIDLVGPKQRGFAMGLNEASGYLAVGAMAFISTSVATSYGILTAMVVLGLGCAVAGTIVSVLFVRDTTAFAALETRQAPRSGSEKDGPPSFAHVLLLTSWKDRTLFSISQAGLVNNLNDGMAWGLFPLLFVSIGLPLKQIGMLTAIYPAVWGFGQLWTGRWSDRVGRKPMIVSGMVLQACGIALLVQAEGFPWLACAMAVMGAGTAFVYPTLLAAVGDVAHPSWRATSVGVYRLWRDGGYVVGALMVGAVTDWLGMHWAINAVAIITALSGLVVALTMRETLKKPPANP